MNEFINNILENHKNKRTVRESYKYDQIEITVHQIEEKLVIWAFNHKTDRFINLGIKKWIKLIDGFKAIAMDLYSKDDRVYVTLSDNKGSRQSKNIGYARVSTKKQLEGNSIEQQIGAIAERYPSVAIYEESQSGANDRSVFNKVLDLLNSGDTLVVTTLDRFCRTVKEGLGYIDILIARGVRIHILNMGLIEDTPMGRLIVTNLLAFAEFERSMIIERTQAGKAIAKTKEGFKEGRPKIYTKEQLDNALSMLYINGGDKSYTEVERIIGISKSTLIRENRVRKLNNMNLHL